MQIFRMPVKEIKTIFNLKKSRKIENPEKLEADLKFLFRILKPV